jgi:hypothetical protein
MRPHPGRESTLPPMLKTTHPPYIDLQGDNRCTSNLINIARHLRLHLRPNSPTPHGRRSRLDATSSAAKSIAAGRMMFAQLHTGFRLPTRWGLVGGQVANRLQPTHAMRPRRRPSRSTLPRLPLNPGDAPSSAAKSRTGFRLPTRWGLVGGQVAQLCPGFRSTRTMRPRRRPSREPAFAYPHDGASSAAKSLNFAQASAQPARWGLVGGQVANRLPPTHTMGPHRRPSC